MPIEFEKEIPQGVVEEPNGQLAWEFREEDTA